MIIRYRNFKFQKPSLPDEGTYYALKRKFMTETDYKFIKYDFKEDNKVFTYLSYVAIVLFLLLLIAVGIESTGIIVFGYLALFFVFFFGEILSWNVMNSNANSFNKKLVKIILDSYDYKDFASKYRNI